MTNTCKSGFDASSRGLAALLVVLLLTHALAVQGQQHCLLVPVPLADRLAQATWVVEAEATAPTVVQDAQGHLLRRYGLTVFKLFREPGGALPEAFLLPGGQLGNLREDVSYAPRLRPGQQGVFFLEPDPQHAGDWRLVAGPQGLIRYDLATHAAAAPFASYSSIEIVLYPALRNPASALGYRQVLANPALAAPRPAARVAGVTAITSFTPASVSAGTGAMLTIAGSGFGATRGTGTVQFRNADDGGATLVTPLDSDYLKWTDTEIQVRVPTATSQGSPVGTGPLTVTSGTGTVSTSATALDVRYGIINIAAGAPEVALRPKLINDNGAGGYTLAYAPSFQQNALAVAAFDRANTQWSCSTGANRTTATTATTAVPNGAATDGINIVTFDATPATLPMGVLGVTYTYFSICPTTPPLVTVPETDFVFANRADWNFATTAPTASQFDFESVALHELGHGIQMAHVINTAAVMHFGIANGQSKRVLGTIDDIAGGRDEVQFSTTPNTSTCGVVPSFVASALGCSAPLPVELALFDARYDKGVGTRLRWATASERNSAHFAVEAQEEGTKKWVEIRRLPAAGASTSPRSYEAFDPRLLSGQRYFRLRMVDRDGSTLYSPVVAVSGSETGLALYPNPAADVLQISGPGSAGRLLFYDAAGHQAASFGLAPGPTEVHISHLRPGLYHVVWTDGRSTRRGRVQKL